MQHETSNAHRKHLNSGLTVKWFRSTGETDQDYSVVCYSDGSRWLFDNAGAEKLTLIGEVQDGLSKAEILQNDDGALVAMYGDGPQMFTSSDEWIESIAEVEKAAAMALLASAH